MSQVSLKDQSAPTSEPEVDDAKVIATEDLEATAKRGVLIIGNDFQALGVMRALEAAHIPCFLLACERGIARHSRHARRRIKNYQLLDDSQPQAGVEFLLDLAKEEQLEGWLIFCVADETVEFLARNHAELSKRYVLPVPPWEVTETFIKKDLANAVAERCGVATPKEYRCDSLEQLLQQPLEYPLVLKPTFKKNYYEKTHDKAVLIRTEDELKTQYARMNELIPASQILAQEFLAGGTESLFSYAAVFDGQKIVNGLSAIRLRQHPMDFGHATTYAEVRDVPELKEASERLLREMGYYGVAEVEFMYDSRTDQYKFLEMNGRFWGWHSLTYAAGLNLPRDLFLVLQGKPVPPTKVNDKATWVRLITDAPTVLREAVRGRMRLSTYLKTVFKMKSCAVWSWRDPLPFIVEVIIAPYLWWKKGF